MNEFLNYLEELRDKYIEECYYRLDWEEDCLYYRGGKELRYEIAKKIVEHKIKLKHLFIIMDWNTENGYIKSLNLLREGGLHGIHLMVMVATCIVESMMEAELGDEWERYMESLEKQLPKDEYTMSDEEYEKYTKSQEVEL
ncbi:MAG: hypothetical protein ACRDCW_08695 [Sarcina sp.]